MGDALPDPEPVSGAPIRTHPIPRLTTVSAEQDESNTPVDPYLALPDPRPTTSESATELVLVAPVDQETAPGPVDPDRSPFDLEPEPVGIEESNPLPLLTGEAPAVESAVLYAQKKRTLTSLTS
jgi:hypothetical protein